MQSTVSQLLTIGRQIEQGQTHSAVNVCIINKQRSAKNNKN